MYGYICFSPTLIETFSCIDKFSEPTLICTVLEFGGVAESCISRKYFRFLIQKQSGLGL